MPPLKVHLPATPTRQKHVVLVSRIFLPEAGAAPIRLAALCHALVEQGYRTTVLTATAPRNLRTSAASSHPESVRVRTFPVVRDKAGYVRGYLPYLSFDLPAFWRILFTHRPDLVVVEPPPTTGVMTRLACAIRRIPYVYFAADIWSDAARVAGSPAPVVAAVTWMERFSMAGAATVLCVSPEFADRLHSIGVVAPIEIVGNGADLARYTASGDAEKLDGPYFIYAGTASEVHGAEIFVDAFSVVARDHPDAKLVFLGQGSSWPELRDRASRLRDGSVLFKPRVSAEVAAGWLRGAVASLASVAPDGYVRAFPTKMYASVACGTPVIFTGVGPGQTFAAQQDLGEAVAYHVDDVAAAMYRALQKPATRDRRRRIAQWAAAHVSLGAVADIAVSAISAVLETSRARRPVRSVRLPGQRRNHPHKEW